MNERLDKMKRKKGNESCGELWRAVMSCDEAQSMRKKALNIPEHIHEHKHSFKEQEAFSGVSQWSGTAAKEPGTTAAIPIHQAV